MTLGQFFNAITEHHYIVLFYFLVLPLVAFLLGFISQGESHRSPWNYIYSLLIFLVCIPGIFAVTLNVYMFLFERQSIMNMDLYLQILPVLSMIFTIWIIRNYVSLNRIPGFDKIGNLIFILTAIISFMWILEKTRIVVFTYMPFFQFVLIFAGFLILLRFMITRFTRS